MQSPLARVAVVEDREDDAYILCNLLERSGSAVTPQVFASGEMALEFLRDVAEKGDAAAVPTAMFVDVSLPGLNGFELLRWMRQQDALSPTVMILLSASDEPRNLGKATQLGAEAYLIKFPSLTGMRELMADIPKTAAQPRPRPVIPVACNLLLATNRS